MGEKWQTPYSKASNSERKTVLFLFLVFVIYIIFRQGLTLQKSLQLLATLLSRIPEPWDCHHARFENLFCTTQVQFYVSFYISGERDLKIIRLTFVVWYFLEIHIILILTIKRVFLIKWAHGLYSVLKTFYLGTYVKHIFYWIFRNYYHSWNTESA